jgi:hypothetical protein
MSKKVCKSSAHPRILVDFLVVNPGIPNGIPGSARGSWDRV